MTSKELNEILLLTFPELKEKFDEETSWQDGIDTGCFITFEDVFMPYVKEVVRNYDLNKINKVFDFIEYLSLIKDDYIENIVYVAILENIATFFDKEKYIQYFKDNTKKIFDNNYK